MIHPFDHILSLQMLFISKFKIALQEADEAEYWLLLCKESKFYPDSSPLLSQLESIQKVLNKIIASSNRNL